MTNIVRICIHCIVVSILDICNKEDRIQLM